MRINQKKLACLMIDQGLRVNDLAKLSGLTRGTISAVKNGKSCSEETGRRISNALGVSLEKLREGRNAQ